MKTYWKNKRGKILCLQNIPDRHLNNIRKMFKGKSRDTIKEVMEEIKRRKKVRKNKKV